MDTDNRLALLPFDDPEVSRLLPRVPDDELRLHWHLVERNGGDLVAGEAVIALLEHLKPTRVLGRMARRFRLAPLVGAIDWVIAKARKRLGRFVRDGPAPRRFP